jgi:N-succinyldiaminopimelate aminotransferase
MNPYLTKLHPYPFEKLAQLKQGIVPPKEYPPILLSIGEPKHAAPDFVLKTLCDNIKSIEQYPITKGLPTLRQSIANWLTQRFSLTAINTEQHILPVNGTREALFAFAQCVLNAQNTKKPLVLMPNPFYQIYEGAVLIAGLTAHYLNTTDATNYLADFKNIDDATWQQTQLIYICSPGNPTGTVIPQEELEFLIQQSDKHNFIIASDECYSEIYPDENNRPVGLLQVCEQLGRKDFKNCMVFHSLSKRSNLPGLRSGFVAGDANIIAKFLQYRTYHGCAMSIPTQLASIAAWDDEQHVLDNRDAYRKKFEAVINILSPVIAVKQPDAGFYLWLKLPLSDTDFAIEIYRRYNINVLPGSLLSRDTKQGNPGQNHVRMALVAPLDQCIKAAQQIKEFLESK